MKTTLKSAVADLEFANGYIAQLQGEIVGLKAQITASDAKVRELQSQLDEAYARCMASGWYILGAEVEAFEQEFATYCGARHCP